MVVSLFYICECLSNQAAMSGSKKKLYILYQFYISMVSRTTLPLLGVSTS